MFAKCTVGVKERFLRRRCVCRVCDSHLNPVDHFHVSDGTDCRPIERREVEKEGGTEGGRDGGRDGGREGWREG